MTNQRENRLFWSAYSILAFLFLLHLLPFAFKDARMWGFNHLIFLPSIWTVIYIIIASVALALPFMPFARGWGEILFNRFSTIFFESSRKYLYRSSFIVIMGVLFVLFPMPTHFLGDGYTVLANLSSSSGNFTKWSEKGITFILFAIQSILGPKGENTALWSFRIVSLFSGLISIWFFFLTAQIIGKDKFRRTLIFLVSLISGTLLLFFGYAENYPPVWIALTGFIYFGLQYLKENGKILWPILFLAFGLFLHLEMGIFLPAFIYLLFARGKGLELYRHFRMIFWTVVSASALIGIAVFAWKYQTNLYFENIFLPLFEGKPSYRDYALISLPHIADIVNLLMLLCPLIFLFLSLAFRDIPKAFRIKDGRFLALGAVFSLLFLSIIDPMLGLPRDWDLFSISAFALTLLLLVIFSEEVITALRKLILPITLYLIIAILPYLVTNLETRNSIAYARYTVDLDLQKSYPVYTVMLRYYADQNDSAQSEMIYAKYHHLYASEYKFKLAEQALAKGMIPKAIEIINSIPPDKFSWRYHNILSSLYYVRQDNRKSLEESDVAIQLNGYSSILFSNRAKILNALRKNDEALACLEKAYQFDKHAVEILEGLAALSLFSGRPDLSIRYSNEMAAVDSLAYKAYYYLARASAVTGQLNQAELNYSKYIKYGTNDSLYEQSKAELKRIIENSKKK